MLAVSHFSGIRFSCLVLQKDADASFGCSLNESYLIFNPRLMMGEVFQILLSTVLLFYVYRSIMSSAEETRHLFMGVKTACF